MQRDIFCNFSNEALKCLINCMNSPRSKNILRSIYRRKLVGLILNHFQSLLCQFHFYFDDLKVQSFSWVPSSFIAYVESLNWRKFELKPINWTDQWCYIWRSESELDDVVDVSLNWISRIVWQDFQNHLVLCVITSLWI